MKTTLYFLAFLLLPAFSSCKKNVQERSGTPAASGSRSQDKTGWMQLNNEWVPVITEFDKLLHAGKKAYLQKDYKESSKKINEANELLIKKAGNGHPDRNELKKSSEDLQKLSEKIEDTTVSESEVDSVLYRVCDVSGKHCWILQDSEDDYWAPEEEINEHIDSAYARISSNDSAGAVNLSKANALIKVKSQNSSHPGTLKYLAKARNELNIILKMIKKDGKVLSSAMGTPIARCYFSLAMTHHISASIEFNDPTDDRHMGNEIRSTSVCLRKAFKYSGVKLNEEEKFTLEHAESMGTDLEKGFSHGQGDIRETLAMLGLLIKKGRMILYPAETEDDFMLS